MVGPVSVQIVAEVHVTESLCAYVCACACVHILMLMCLC